MRPANSVLVVSIPESTMPRVTDLPLAPVCQAGTASWKDGPIERKYSAVWNVLAGMSVVVGVVDGVVVGAGVGAGVGDDDAIGEGVLLTVPPSPPHPASAAKAMSGASRATRAGAIARVSWRSQGGMPAGTPSTNPKWCSQLYQDNPD